MPDLKMSGDIGFEELSPQLQALIGAGGSGGFGGNVLLKTEVLSVTATEERQKEFTIPKSGYIQGTHNFELRLGSVWIHPDRYQIQGNKVVFNENEVGIAQGRRLDFVFCYLEKGEDGESVLDGASLKDGSVTKEKLSAELQKQIDGHDTSINEVKTSIDSVRQSVNGVSTKLDSSVKDVESSNNFNSIKIIKNDGTATDVPIKILGGGSSTSLNVFKTAEQGGSFTATKEINSFVIDELEENMDVSLVFKNLFLVKNVDFTVDKETKTVALTFNLKVDETIYYILTGTSFSYNDLDSAPNVGDTNGLATTSKEVVGAINEMSQQIKECDKRQKMLECPITTSVTDFADDNANVGETIYFYSWGNTTSSTIEHFSWYRFEKAIDSRMGVLYSTSNSGRTYMRYRTATGWQSWIEIATTDVVGYREALENPSTSQDLITYVANKKLTVGFLTGNRGELTNFTNIPSDLGDFMMTVQGGVTYNGLYYAKVTIRSMTGTTPLYEGSIFNNTTFTGWTQIATTTKIPFSCTPSAGFTITAQNCYRINNEIVFNVDIKRTDGADIESKTQHIFSMPYKPTIEFSVTSVARDITYGLMSSFAQTILNPNGAVWSFVNNPCGYISVSGRFEL